MNNIINFLSFLKHLNLSTYGDLTIPQGNPVHGYHSVKLITANKIFDINRLSEKWKTRD